jgi:nucleoside-diphosphate-sugar epimerase
MYAVTGITGKVGGIVARTLLAAGLPVRAVVRDAGKGRPWVEKGCEVAIASISDAAGLRKAFYGADGTEVNVKTETSNFDENERTTGTISPGLLYVADKYQLGMEALIPIKTKTMSTFEAEEHLQVLTPV